MPILGHGIDIEAEGRPACCRHPDPRRPRRIKERVYVDHAGRTLDKFERDALVEPDLITEDHSHALKSLEEASQAAQRPPEVSRSR